MHRIRRFVMRHWNEVKADLTRCADFWQEPFNADIMFLIGKTTVYKQIALRLTKHNVKLWQPPCLQLLVPALRQNDIVSPNDLSLLGRNVG